MKTIKTKIPGVWLLEPRVLEDERGKFIKTFHRGDHQEKSLASNLAEIFYSVSKKGVIRGMHLQVPPYDLEKIVYVTRGRVLDVVLDLRKGSPTYKEYVVEELSADNHRMLHIPKGCAHGFIALEDDTSMHYFQTSMYSPEHDVGIHPHSFGFDWGVAEPVMSARDRNLPPLAEFDSPFIYEDTR